jgi:hypothetical protein
MKINLSFKDYLDEKQRLKAAGENCPRVKHSYKVTKYCKIPLHDGLNEDDKVYISLKPKDKIEILWEYESVEHPTAKQITLTSNGEVMYFTWSNAKIAKWVNETTHRI